MDDLQELRRTKRLLEMVWLISNGPRAWTRKRLAAHYEISERQITKDLTLLREGLKFPIQRSAAGYYSETVPRLPSVSFSFEEALAILLAVRAGRALVGVDGESLAAAVGRLESLFPQELRNVLRQTDRSGEDLSERGPRLGQLQQAIGQNRQVQLEYVAVSQGGAVTTRVVEPYAVIPYGRSWHFVGYCHLRAAVRLFKLDRIQQLTILTSGFTPPTDFDLTEFLDSGWGLMRGIIGPVETVTLHFRPPTASFVAEERWHPSQQVTWQADNTVIFQVQVVVTPELCRWVYGYGSDVTVLAPAHLRDWVVAEAQRVVAADCLPAEVG